MVGCIEVSRQRLDGIQAGLIVASGSLTEAWAYPSGAHETGYFVAAEIEAPEYLGDGDEHLYFVISLESRGLTFSVDEVTDEFSDWPDGSMMDPRTSIDDPGVQEARECLREAQRNR